MRRVTVSDLEQAALWLEECDAGPAMRKACLRVADSLRADMQARERESAIRFGMKETGAPRKAVARALDALQPAVSVKTTEPPVRQMPRKPNIEMIRPDERDYDAALVGGGTLRKGRLIYRVMLRAGQAPQCSINGEPYVAEAGKVDQVMWRLLVAVRRHFNA